MADSLAESTAKPVVDAPADNFSLSRWSRLKRAQRSAQSGNAPDVVAELARPNAELASSASGAVDAVAAVEQAPTALPPLSSVSLASDFTPFMQAQVPAAVRQQALKALFREPHFNVMDGLDIYIDDYTSFEPIPPEVLATLSSWKTILNPPQQVVTPGGYAVDAESAEGRAVLAARERTDAAAEGLDLVATDAHAPPASTQAAGADTAVAGDQAQLLTERRQHARHNTRVGDFIHVDDVGEPSLPQADSSQ